MFSVTVDLSLRCSATSPAGFFSPSSAAGSPIAKPAPARFSNAPTTGFTLAVVERLALGLPGVAVVGEGEVLARDGEIDRGEVGLLDLGEGLVAKIGRRVIDAIETYFFSGVERRLSAALT